MSPRYLVPTGRVLLNFLLYGLSDDTATRLRRAVDYQRSDEHGVNSAMGSERVDYCSASGSILISEVNHQSGRGHLTHGARAERLAAAGPCRA
jgi:hypothetical protein